MNKHDLWGEAKQTGMERGWVRLVSMPCVYIQEEQTELMKINTLFKNQICNRADNLMAVLHR